MLPYVLVIPLLAVRRDWGCRALRGVLTSPARGPSRRCPLSPGRRTLSFASSSGECSSAGAGVRISPPTYTHGRGLALDSFGALVSAVPLIAAVYAPEEPLPSAAAKLSRGSYGLNADGGYEYDAESDYTAGGGLVSADSGTPPGGAFASRSSWSHWLTLIGTGGEPPADCCAGAPTPIHSPLHSSSQARGSSTTSPTTRPTSSRRPSCRRARETSRGGRMMRFRRTPALLPRAAAGDLRAQRLARADHVAVPRHHRHGHPRGEARFLCVP